MTVCKMKKVFKLLGAVSANCQWDAAQCCICREIYGNEDLYGTERVPGALQGCRAWL